MTRPFHIALLVALCVGAPAAAAPPVYQLRAVQDLVGLQPGAALDVRVEVQADKGGKALESAATTAWSLLIAPCTALDDGTARIAPRRAYEGMFRLTVPLVRSANDAHMCVVRWADGAAVHDPARLRFCVGDLTLRECHPGWWETHCRGVSAAECDKRAIAAGVKAGDDISGLLYIERDGQRRKVPWTGGSGCPVYTKPWGVVFARRGVLMTLDLDAQSASPALKPPAGVTYHTPWPDGLGGLLLVSSSAAGRHLLRAPASCAGAADCKPEPLRTLPSAIGRIVGLSKTAVLSTHRLSRHAVRVPLDPARPVEQLSIAAPTGGCAVEVGGVRVTNDGAPPVDR